MKIRIYYEDTDAGGVVYHSNYLKFCERARSELFFANNINIFDASKGHFLMSKADCAFLYPARLGDTLLIRSFLLTLKRASLQIIQEIYLEKKLCFKATFTLAYLSNSAITPMPKSLREQIKQMLEPFK